MTKKSFVRFVIMYVCLGFTFFSCNQVDVDTITSQESTELPTFESTTIHSMEEFEAFLIQEGHSQAAIQAFLEENDLENAFSEEEVTMRNDNCSCTDEANFTVFQFENFFVAMVYISPYDPRIFIEYQKYDCDGNPDGQGKVPMGSSILDGCSQNTQSAFFNINTLPCDNCTSPNLYDLTFILERTGAYPRDCDYRFFYGVPCSI